MGRAKKMNTEPTYKPRGMFINRSLLQKNTAISTLDRMMTVRGYPIISDVTYFEGAQVIEHPAIISPVVNRQYDLYLLLEALHRGDPFVQAAVESLVVQTTQAGYRITFNPREWEKSDDVNMDARNKVVGFMHNWLDKLSFRSVLRATVRSLLIFGNAYIFLKRGGVPTGVPGRPRGNGMITELRVLHPAMIHVARKASGEVVAFVQRNTQSTAGWTKMLPKDVIHLKLEEVADRTYGVTFLESMLRDLKFQRDNEDNLRDLIEDYLIPLYHARLGLETPQGWRPATPESVDDFEVMWSQRASGQDLITDIGVQVEPLNPGRGNIDTKTILDQFQTNIQAPPGVPEELLTGRAMSTTQAAMIIKYEAMKKRCEYSHEIIIEAIENRLFIEGVKELLYSQVPDLYKNNDINLYLDYITNMPQFSFKIIETTNDKFDRLSNMVNAGGLTFNEYRIGVDRPALYETMTLADGTSINPYDYTLPILQIMVTNATGKAQVEATLTAQREKISNDRETQKKLPNTSTVTQSGKPKAKSAKTGRRPDRGKEANSEVDK